MLCVMGRATQLDCTSPDCRTRAGVVETMMVADSRGLSVENAVKGERAASDDHHGPFLCQNRICIVTLLALQFPAPELVAFTPM